jgi:thioredoxin reductase
MEQTSWHKRYNPFARWFAWLQKDNPVGDVVFYPELSDNGETSVKGVYIVGDLTGIPLLKLATNGGQQLIERFGPVDTWDAPSTNYTQYADAQGPIKDNTVEAYDLVIIGAGPAGVAAAIEAKKQKLNFIVLEASDREYNTIENFPKGKPMFYEPEGHKETSPLTMAGKTKEELISHLHSVSDDAALPVRFMQKVDAIEALGGGCNLIKTKTHTYVARKTVLAIGKSGNARRLNVPGEHLPHVSNKLYDPGEYKDERILVIGGGDTALESAILLARAGNHVTISYRKDAFSRPKPGNINMINKLVKEGSITLFFNSEAKEIREQEVDFIVNKKDIETKSFDQIFVMIGTQLPYEFFETSGIKIANAKTTMTWWWLAFAVSFSNIVYFGKASSSLDTSRGIGSAVTSIFSGDLTTVLIKLIAWLSVLAFVGTGLVCLADLIKKRQYYFATKWQWIKHGYFFFVLVLFLTSFLGSKYFDFMLGGKDPYFWYGFLYTTTIGLFGIRRIITTKKRYVTLQTTSLFLIQALPLFIIPNILLPWLDSLGLIHEWIKETVFLGGEWWRFVGFILAWPLFFANVLTEQPSMFWLGVSLIQTFVIIPFLVIKWGKGAYCAWICSCGAMAETLGDEYRQLAPHGAKAKKMENSGQIILLLILITTTLHILGWVPSLSGALEGINAMLSNGYKFFVDILLAGTIGVPVLTLVRQVCYHLVNIEDYGDTKNNRRIIWNGGLRT